MFAVTWKRGKEAEIFWNLTDCCKNSWVVTSWYNLSCRERCFIWEVISSNPNFLLLNIDIAQSYRDLLNSHIDDFLIFYFQIYHIAKELVWEIAHLFYKLLSSHILNCLIFQRLLSFGNLPWKALHWVFKKRFCIPFLSIKFPALRSFISNFQRNETVILPITSLKLVWWLSFLWAMNICSQVFWNQQLLNKVTPDKKGFWHVHIYQDVHCKKFLVFLLETFDFYNKLWSLIWRRSAFFKNTSAFLDIPL